MKDPDAYITDLETYLKRKRARYALHQRAMKMKKKKETLWQFLTRPTGFGRTSWTSFITIAAFVIGMAWYALFSGSEETAARWVSGGFAVAITAIMAHGTLKNFREENKSKG